MKLKVNLYILIPLLTFFVSSYIYLLSFYLSTPGTNTDSNLQPQNNSQTQNSTEKVIRVIDGDTFEIEGGIKVRLIGIDTPEMKNKNKTIDCFAQEAKDMLTKLILNKNITLIKDVSETDKYGRLLRYVYIDNQFINDILVKEGYAKIATFPPDVKLTNTFLESERLARESNAGLWKSCK